MWPEQLKFLIFSRQVLSRPNKPTVNACVFGAQEANTITWLFRRVGSRRLTSPSAQGHKRAWLKESSNSLHAQRKLLLTGFPLLSVTNDSKRLAFLGFFRNKRTFLAHLIYQNQKKEVLQNKSRKKLEGESRPTQFAASLRSIIWSMPFTQASRAGPGAGSSRARQLPAAAAAEPAGSPSASVA